MHKIVGRENEKVEGKEKDKETKNLVTKFAWKMETVASRENTSIQLIMRNLLRFLINNRLLFSLSFAQQQFFVCYFIVWVCVYKHIYGIDKSSWN